MVPGKVKVPLELKVMIVQLEEHKSVELSVEMVQLVLIAEAYFHEPTIAGAGVSLLLQPN